MENWREEIAEIRAIMKETAKRQEEYEAKRQKEQEEYEAKKQKEQEEYEAKRQKEAEVARKEAEAERKKTEAERKEYEAERQKEQKEYEAKRQKEVAEINKMIGGITNNNGKMAEEVLFNSLAATKTIAKVHFDGIGRNWKKNITLDGGKEFKGEWDIILTNKVAVCIVEAKYRVSKKDVVRLAGEQVKSFKALYPEYNDYKFYLGIGGMSFGSDVEEEAKKRGIAMLRVKGNVVEIIDSNLKVY